MTPKPQLALNIRLPVWRARLLVTLMFLGFMALAARALYVQAINNDFLQAEAAKRYSRTPDLIANRGPITDRNGQALAISTAVEIIAADPTRVAFDKIPAEKLDQLSKLLSMDVKDIQHKLSQKKRYVELKKQTTPNIAAQVMSLKIPGVRIETKYKRYYPSGEAMAQLLGFTNNDQKGIEGLEKSYQETLAGKSGSRRVTQNNKAQVVDEVTIISAVKNGTELELSIDQTLQYLAFSGAKNAVLEHDAKSASVVILDVVTGEILAVANWPSFNPNNRSTFKPAEVRNRAITDQFEPGSTIKPFTIAAALEGRFVTPDTLIDIEDGSLRIGNRTIKDTHPEKSLLTVTDIIQQSSNVGTAKIARKMKADDLWEVLSQSGFGQPPRLRFPGSASGSLRAPKNWKAIEQATISYGMGISVSLLQLARAYSIFARNGMLVPITFEKRTQAAKGTRVISEHTAQAVLQMLEKVTHDGGTGGSAAIPGYRVAGKTGTAKVASEGSYADGKYRSSFVGIAPVSNPRLIVAVVVEEPSHGAYYGSLVAAPVFRKVMEEALKTLGIKPDALIKGQEAKRNALQGPV
ncbi:MAG: penicillin-binding protein 2 [Proteobacteria bacterium]|nr:penicillin-binding protein 2 [Pseudomonadota bacterium]